MSSWGRSETLICDLVIVVRSSSCRIALLNALTEGGQASVEEEVQIEGSKLSFIRNHDGRKVGIIVSKASDVRARMDKMSTVATRTFCSFMALIKPGYTAEDMKIRRTQIPPGCAVVFVEDLEMLMELLGYREIEAMQREVLKPLFADGAGVHRAQDGSVVVSSGGSTVRAGRGSTVLANVSMDANGFRVLMGMDSADNPPRVPVVVDMPASREEAEAAIAGRRNRPAPAQVDRAGWDPDDVHFTGLVVREDDEHLHGGRHMVSSNLGFPASQEEAEARFTALRLAPPRPFPPSRPAARRVFPIVNETRPRRQFQRQVPVPRPSSGPEVVGSSPPVRPRRPAPHEPPELDAEWDLMSFPPPVNFNNDDAEPPALPWLRRDDPRDSAYGMEPASNSVWADHLASMRQLDQAESDRRTGLPPGPPAVAPRPLTAEDRRRMGRRRVDEQSQQQSLTRIASNRETKAAISKVREEDEDILAMCTTADDNTCTICLASHITTALIPCRHFLFCHACITKWLDVNDGCPTCKTPVASTIQLLTKFDVHDEHKRRKLDPVNTDRDKTARARRKEVADALRKEADELEAGLEPQ